MERIVGYVEYDGEEYEVKYNTDDAEINYRKVGNTGWFACCTGPNDDWHIKKNVLGFLKLRN